MSHSPCPSCGHRRPNGTTQDLQRHLLEALPAGVECEFAWIRSPHLEPRKLRVTIEEPGERNARLGWVKQLAVGVSIGFGLGWALRVAAEVFGG